MTTQALREQGARAPQVPALLRRAWQINPTLTALVVAMAISTVGALIGTLVDPRTVLGVSTWAKTAKFSLSVLLYVGTLLALLPRATRHARLAGRLATATGAILGFEMALIILQAARGEPIHFNSATPFDVTLWRAMTVTIMVLYVITLAGLVVTALQPAADRVLAWGVRLGVLIMIVGMTQGFLMPGPKGDQLERLQAGQRVDMIGAHTVGAPDGGPGLPVVGWSAGHGDLRIGHFVGLHGLQVVPLLALLLSRLRWRRLREGHRLALLGAGAAGYLGLVALVTWQALRGQALLQPDALTWVVLGALAAAVGAAAAAALAHARFATRAA